MSSHNTPEKEGIYKMDPGVCRPLLLPTHNLPQAILVFPEGQKRDARSILELGLYPYQGYMLHLITPSTELLRSFLASAKTPPSTLNPSPDESRSFIRDVKRGEKRAVRTSPQVQ